MTEFDSGLFVITCHKCLNENDFEAGDWHDGWNQAKSIGWIAREVEGEWVNFCSNVCYFYFQKDQKRYLAKKENPLPDVILTRQLPPEPDDEDELVKLLPF